MPNYPKIEYEEFSCECELTCLFFEETPYQCNAYLQIGTSQEWKTIDTQKHPSNYEEFVKEEEATGGAIATATTDGLKALSDSNKDRIPDNPGPGEPTPSGGDNKESTLEKVLKKPLNESVKAEIKKQWASGRPNEKDWSAGKQALISQFRDQCKKKCAGQKGKKAE